MRKPNNYRSRIYEHYTSERMSAVLAYSAADYANKADSLLHYLRGWLPEDKNAQCLDVACGAGQLLYTLSRSGYQNIAGIDISPEQVATARKIWPKVEEADAIEFLNDHPGEYDFITGFDIVEHFDKNELFDFLEAIFRALRPGGRLVLQTPNAESPWGLQQRYGDITHELAFDPYSLDHVLRLVGFKSYEPRECGPYVHGIKSLVRWVLWRMIRVGILVWNLAETGSKGSGIYTRVFITKVNKLNLED